MRTDCASTTDAVRAVQAAARLLGRAFAVWLLGSLAAFGQQPAAQLRVTTDPPDALVTCDGTLQQAAPVLLENLAAGRHLIAANKPGYREARESIVLSEGQRTAVHLKLDPIMGLVLIHSVPEAAEVTIDGAYRGATPLLLTDLPVGRYRMQVGKTGYVQRELELLIENRTPQRIDVNLTSDTATLVLTSDPPGADVALDGVPRGKTPATIERIPEGDIRIQVTLKGYAPYEQQIRLLAGETENLRTVLEPLPGTLKIVSIPIGARVYVDNQFKGESPVTLEGLPPGTYRVRAELQGFDAVARDVVVRRASDITEEFRLSTNTGQIRLTTQPAGVTVLIDGKPVGETRAPAGQTDRVSDPLVIPLIEPGTHDVELTRKGYFSKTIQVEVEENRTVTLHQILNRRFIPDYEVRTQADVIRGVLREIDPLGNVQIEVRPGIIRTIPAGEITERGPIRDESR